MKNTTKHWVTIFLLSWIIKSTLTYFSFDSYHKEYVLHDESISQRWDKKEQKWVSTSRYRNLSRNPNYQMVKVERKDNFIQHAYKVYFHFEVFLLVFCLITFGFWYFDLVNFHFMNKINSKKSNGINRLIKSPGFLTILIWEAIHFSLYFLAAERPTNFKIRARDLFFPFNYDSAFMDGSIFQINGVYDETELMVYTLLGLLFLIVNLSKLQSFQSPVTTNEEENQISDNVASQYERTTKHTIRSTQNENNGSRMTTKTNQNHESIEDEIEPSLDDTVNKRLIYKIFKFDPTSYEAKYQAEFEQWNIQFWWDILKDRISGPITNDEEKEFNIDTKEGIDLLKRWVWGHADEYGKKYLDSDDELKKTKAAVRVIVFGHIYSVYNKIKREVDLLSLSDSFKEEFEAGRFHAKASVYGAVKFALLSGCTKSNIIDWFPLFEDDDDLIQGVNGFELQILKEINEDENNYNTYVEKLKSIFDGKKRVPIYELNESERAKAPDWFKGPCYTEGDDIFSLSKGEFVKLTAMEKSIYTEIMYQSMVIERLAQIGKVSKEMFESTPYLRDIVEVVDKGTEWFKESNPTAYDDLLREGGIQSSQENDSSASLIRETQQINEKIEDQENSGNNNQLMKDEDNIFLILYREYQLELNEEIQKIVQTDNICPSRLVYEAYFDHGMSFFGFIINYSTKCDIRKGIPVESLLRFHLSIFVNELKDFEFFKKDLELSKRFTSKRLKRPVIPEFERDILEIADHIIDLFIHEFNEEKYIDPKDPFVIDLVRNSNIIDQDDDQMEDVGIITHYKGEPYTGKCISNEEDGDYTIYNLVNGLKEGEHVTYDKNHNVISWMYYTEDELIFLRSYILEKDPSSAEKIVYAQQMRCEEEVFMKTANLEKMVLRVLSIDNEIKEEMELPFNEINETFENPKLLENMLKLLAVYQQDYDSGLIYFYLKDSNQDVVYNIDVASKNDYNGWSFDIGAFGSIANLYKYERGVLHGITKHFTGDHLYAYSYHNEGEEFLLYESLYYLQNQIRWGNTPVESRGDWPFFYKKVRANKDGLQDEKTTSYDEDANNILTDNDYTEKQIASGLPIVEFETFKNLRGVNFKEVKGITLDDVGAGEDGLQDVDGPWNFSQITIAMIYKAFSKKTFKSALNELLVQNKISESDVVKHNGIFGVNIVSFSSWIGQGFKIEVPNLPNSNIIIISNENSYSNYLITLTSTNLSELVKVDWIKGIDKIYDGEKAFKKCTTMYLDLLNVPLLLNSEETSPDIVILNPYFVPSKAIIDSIIEKNGGKDEFKYRGDIGDNWKYVYEGENFSIGYLKRGFQIKIFQRIDEDLENSEQSLEFVFNENQAKAMDALQKIARVKGTTDENDKYVFYFWAALWVAIADAVDDEEEDEFPQGERGISKYFMSIGISEERYLKIRERVINENSHPAIISNASSLNAKDKKELIKVLIDVAFYEEEEQEVFASEAVAIGIIAGIIGLDLGNTIKKIQADYQLDENELFEEWEKMEIPFINTNLM